MSHFSIFPTTIMRYVGNWAVVAHVFNPSTWENLKFQDSEGYTEKPKRGMLKQDKTNQQKKQESLA